MARAGGAADRANCLAHGCCRRGKRAAVGGVEEWALGMSVHWASPCARALGGLYLEHLGLPSTKPPGVPPGLWLRIAFRTFTVHESGAFTIT
jgi:hypothetical protein